MAMFTPIRIYSIFTLKEPYFMLKNNQIKYFTENYIIINFINN